MTQEDIKAQIDANNEMIEHLYNPTQFTLNKLVANLLEENDKLQHICQHEFEDGKCIYCYMEENK